MTEQVPQINTAATRIALLVARSLTDFQEDRIPERLPTDLDELAQTILELEATAADYAERAQQDPPLDSARTRAWSMMIHTRAAVDLCRTVLAYGQTAAADPAPAHLASEAVLLAVLTWRMATGQSRDVLTNTGLNCALFTAGQITVERLKPNSTDATAASNPTLDEARGRVGVADDGLHEDRRDTALANKVIADIAHDAYAIGLALLRVGEQDRARRALNFAYLNGVRQAATLIPEPLASPKAPYDSESRIDFATHADAWRERADLANRLAQFFPADGEHSTADPQGEGGVELPCLEVAGIQGYLYLHPDGQVKFSLHLDTTEEWLLDGNGSVPVEVSMNDRVRVVADSDGTRIFVDDDLVYEQ
jgi:hypothetical protein